MVTEAERQALINEGEIVIKTGEQWYAKLGSELEKKFPAGYFVIINIENGDYVVDEDEIVASQKREKYSHQRPEDSFGRSSAPTLMWNSRGACDEGHVGTCPELSSYRTGNQRTKIRLSYRYWLFRRYSDGIGAYS